jgi:hypothetical protein
MKSSTPADAQNKKGEASSIIDIEHEYNGYLCDVWQDLSGQTKNFGVTAEQLKETYDVVSTGSIQFLKDKLKNLEKNNG